MRMREGFGCCRHFQFRIRRVRESSTASEPMSTSVCAGAAPLQTSFNRRTRVRGIAAVRTQTRLRRRRPPGGGISVTPRPGATCDFLRGAQWRRLSRPTWAKGFLMPSPVSCCDASRADAAREASQGKNSTNISINHYTLPGERRSERTAVVSTTECNNEYTHTYLCASPCCRRVAAQDFVGAAFMVQSMVRSSEGVIHCGLRLDSVGTHTST